MMKLKFFLICICLILGVATLAGCAAAATTANVVRLEGGAAVVATQTSVHAATIPQGSAAPAVVRAMENEADGYLVEITPPPSAPVQIIPVSGREDGAGQPAAETPAPAATVAPTPEPTPAPTPEPTPEPTLEPTPERDYTVEEWEEYLDGYVSAKTVNMRKGPGTKYDILDTFSRYDTLLVTGESGDWYRVKLDDLRGYMRKEYVSLGAVPTPEPEPTPTPAPERTPEPTEAPAPAETPAPTPTPVPESTSTPNLSTSDELYLIAQIVYKEGDAESYVAVANVIYNRIQSSSFPNTATEVIYQKNQFSTSNLKTPSSAAIEAVQQIFVEGNLIFPAEVMYFHAASRGDDRDGYTHYATYGGNAFFYK